MSKVILTFDDGPMGDETKAKEGVSLNLILEELKKRGAPGVFYVLGQEVKAEPNLAKAIAKEGHSIQSHSWSHERLPSLSEEALTRDLQDTQEIITTVIGTVPDRLRPPYGAGWVGKKDEKLIKVAAKLKLTLTGWDVDTNDWKKQTTGLEPKYYQPPRQQWPQLYDKTKSPLDILMHVKMATARSLGGFMDKLTSEGWEFTTYPATQTQSQSSSKSQTQKAPQGKYQIQIFAGSVEGAAEKASEAGALGYSGVEVVQDNGLSKVRVGRYDTRSQAESVLGPIAVKFPGAFIVGGD
jgi:peptidoglycan/xylan/chitin deacetylase (PgdA/CDA1 family)